MLGRIGTRIAKIIALYLSIVAWIIALAIVGRPIFRWFKSGFAQSLTEQILGAPYPAYYLLPYVIPFIAAYGLTRAFQYFESLEPPNAR
jgi:hypothetical protein